MGLKLVAKPELTEWENTYIRELQDSEVTEETRSGMLNLLELKDFMTYIDRKNQEIPPANIDGVGIYLTRWSECDIVVKINKITSKGNVDQLSFVVVPLVGTEIFVETNQKTGEEEIMCLFPGLQDKSGTGLCPPCVKKNMGDKKNSD
jgi:hypothetical protein